jgi:hypothetical protein
MTIKEENILFFILYVTCFYLFIIINIVPFVFLNDDFEFIIIYQGLSFAFPIPDQYTNFFNKGEGKL